MNTILTDIHVEIEVDTIPQKQDIIQIPLIERSVPTAGDQDPETDFPVMKIGIETSVYLIESQCKTLL